LPLSRFVTKWHLRPIASQVVARYRGLTARTPRVIDVLGSPQPVGWQHSAVRAVHPRLVKVHSMARKSTHESAALVFTPVSHQPLTGTNGHRNRLNLQCEFSSAFNSILVDVDATADAHPALERAVHIAQGCGARLRIVDVVRGADIRSHRRGLNLDDEGARGRRERLQQLAERVSGVAVDWDLLAGSAGPALIEEVRRSGHDLLMRSHWRDVVSRGPREFRDVDKQLFRMCPCPVWAVGYGVAPARPHIVAAVRVSPEDGSDDQLNGRVVKVAAQIAQAERGWFTLLHAWTAFAERKVRAQTADEDFAMYLDATRWRVEREIARQAASSPYIGPTRIQVELRHGNPEQVIPEYIVGQGVDVLVVGTKARMGIRGLLLGNMAERLLRLVPCSVIAVKHG
jgi:universal stress protein E